MGRLMLAWSHVAVGVVLSLSVRCQRGNACAPRSAAPTARRPIRQPHRRTQVSALNAASQLVWDGRGSARPHQRHATQDDRHHASTIARYPGNKIAWAVAVHVLSSDAARAGTGARATGEARTVVRFLLALVERRTERHGPANLVPGYLAIVLAWWRSILVAWRWCGRDAPRPSQSQLLPVQGGIPASADVAADGRFWRGSAERGAARRCPLARTEGTVLNATQHGTAGQR